MDYTIYKHDAYMMCVYVIRIIALQKSISRKNGGPVVHNHARGSDPPRNACLEGHPPPAGGWGCGAYFAPAAGWVMGSLYRKVVRCQSSTVLTNEPLTIFREFN